MLGVWVVYPTVYTVWRSFYDREGDDFVGLDNYQTIFTTDTLVTAIKNNAIWVLVVPAFVTAVGLIFARPDGARSAGRSRSRPPSSCRWRSPCSPQA